jgi:ATP-dependent Lhr-like helicase
LLARIHRYTLKRLRSEIEPVSIADYQRFLFHWQGLGAERREGREALLAVLHELQGLALPAAVWERDVLPARLADYGSDLLDQLCVAGELVWWRPRPAPAAVAGRASTVATSPIAIVPRETLAAWRTLAYGRPADAGGESAPPLSSAAQRVQQLLVEHGASFFLELVQGTGLLRVQVEDALGELVARGYVTADSFNGLRALLTPQSRRRGFRGRGRFRGTSRFDAAGRWALLKSPPEIGTPGARRAAVEHAATALLRRYGVVCRRLLEREALAPTWRELLEFYRRAEARGEIRGGRFVEAFGGEQFALTEAVEALRRVRREGRAAASDEWITLSAADPLHLPCVLDGAARVAAVGSHRLAFKNGTPVAARTSSGIEWLARLDEAAQRQAAAALAPPQQSLPRLNRAARA